MSESNYENCLEQLATYGLEVEELVLDRIIRVKAPGDRAGTKSGWYKIHQIITEKGDQLYVGTYGNWKDGAGTQKVDIKGHSITKEERASITKKMVENKKQAEAERDRKATKAAHAAQKMFNRCSDSGESPYLVEKGVKWYPGARFSPADSLVLPMTGEKKEIVGLQIIHGNKETVKKKGRNKDFWPHGLAKKGSYFQFGGIPTWICLIAEGYATAATLHDATNLPVAVVWDAGNITPATENIKKRYKNTRFLICADDDINNIGQTNASRAAMSVSGAYILPDFGEQHRADREQGIKGDTDFNDLAKIAGIEAVRNQLEVKIDELGWRDRAALGAPSAGLSTSGGGGNGRVSLVTVDQALERFSLVIPGNGTIFDHDLRRLISKSDAQDMMVERGWRLMKERAEIEGIKQVQIENVGFDPVGDQPNITCNGWGGWPTKPDKGNPELLLDLLQYLCNYEKDPEMKVYNWILKWLAYPIQNPGKKMKTALVFHGGQGTGKNLFFEAYAKIYGEYARIIDQPTIDSQFTDWASRKLFMIADEVLARSEVYHSKNRLKGLVTGDNIIINTKNVAAYEERNHVNFVFLSNEHMPLAIDKDDRRYVVLRTPPKMDLSFYSEVAYSLKNENAIAALHDYLLNLDLGDFTTHSKPPHTQAKDDLILLGMDSPQRFLLSWTSGEVDGVPICHCKTMDLYQVYLRWCRTNGVRFPRESNLFIGAVSKEDGYKKADQHAYESFLDERNGKKAKRPRVILIPHEKLEEKYQKRADETKVQYMTRCTLDFKFSQETNHE